VHSQFVLAFALAALALLWPVRPAHAQDPADVDYLLVNINAARAAQGLPPYALNSLLTAAAQAHSEDMAAQATLLLDAGESIGGAVTHTGSDGSSAADRVARTGYPAIQVGEDIYASRSGPQAAFEWWMGSSAHRNNILHPRFLEIGIGAAPGPEGLTLFTLVFAHSEDSPVLPAPALPPAATPIPPTPLPTEAPTITPLPSPTLTPSATSTVTRIQLPPAEEDTASTDLAETESPDGTAAPRGVASGPRLWVILLEVAAAIVAIFTFVKLRR
jgi:uncharacterized protein YkwD